MPSARRTLYGQPQARAAVGPGRGRVELGEGLENGLLLVRFDTDAGVGDRVEEFGPATVAFLAPDGGPDLAPGREFDGIAEQIDQDLAQPARIALGFMGQVRGGLGQQGQALGLGLGQQHGLGLAQDLGRIVGDTGHLHRAGLDRGQLQNVAEQGHEGFARHFQGAQEFELPVGKRGAAQHVHHAEDGIHGRADFVAHGGQESAFGLVGRLGRILGRRRTSSMALRALMSTMTASRQGWP